MAASAALSKGLNERASATKDREVRRACREPDRSRGSDPAAGLGVEGDAREQPGCRSVKVACLNSFLIYEQLDHWLSGFLDTRLQEQLRWS